MTSHPREPGSFSLSDLQAVLNYMEDNLLEELTPAVIASHFFGISVPEYRYRAGRQSSDSCAVPGVLL